MSMTARVAPPRYLPGQALHAEWTKFRTVAGPAWLLAGIVTLAVAVAAAAATHHLLLGHGLAAQALRSLGAAEVGITLDVHPVRAGEGGG